MALLLFHDGTPLGFCRRQLSCFRAWLHCGGSLGLASLGLDQLIAGELVHWLLFIIIIIIRNIIIILVSKLGFIFLVLDHQLTS